MVYVKHSLVVLALLLLTVAPLSAQPHHYQPPSSQPAESTQKTDGGTTNQVVQAAVTNPTIIIPDTFTEPVPMTKPEEPPSVTTGAGLTLLWSSHVKSYVLPLSYKLNPDFKIEANIPYIYKELKGEYTGEELRANGLGDISVGCKYRWGREETLQGVTVLNVKTPTGSYKQFENRKEILALGTGSWDFSINQTISRVMGPWRFIGTLGYRFNTKSDYTETNNNGDNIKYENRMGDIFNYLAGVQYTTSYRWLILYAHALGVVQGRSQYKETDVQTNTVRRDEEKKDRLATLDLNFGAQLMITTNAGIRLGLFIPALTAYDPDVTNYAPREWVVDFGLVGRF